MAKILTTPVRSAGPTGQAGIHIVFRGLKFEPDTEIEQKRAFFIGLNLIPRLICGQENLTGGYIKHPLLAKKFAPNDTL